MTKALSILLLTFLMPIVLANLFLLSMKLTVMNPAFVKKELKSHNAYQIVNKNFPEIAAQMFSKEMFSKEKDSDGKEAEEEGGPKPMFDEKSAIAFAQNVVNEDVLESKTEAVIDSVWPWIFSGQKLKEVPIQDFKNKLYNDIMGFFRTQYDALPYCRSPQDFQYDLKTCKIQGKSFDELVKKFQMQKFGNTTTSLFNVGGPDSVNIAAFAENNPDTGSGYKKIAGVQKTLAPITKNFYFIPIVLLALIFLLARLFAGSWKKTPKIFGIYLIIINSIFLVIGLVAAKLAFPKLIDFANAKINVMPNIKTQLIVPLLKDILSKFGGMQVKISVSLIIFGTILIVGFWILNKFVFKKPTEKIPEAAK